MTGLLVPKLDQFMIRHEGTRVLLFLNGRLVADMEWRAADMLARALIVQARKAEEEAQAERIILDDALLFRAGFPLGLTNRPDLTREVYKEAAWNSDLRRYLPGGIRSRERFGTPTIIKHPPKGTTNDDSEKT